MVLPRGLFFGGLFVATAGLVLVLAHPSELLFIVGKILLYIAFVIGCVTVYATVRQRS